jgi:hypothetical protein
MGLVGAIATAAAIVVLASLAVARLIAAIFGLIIAIVRLVIPIVRLVIPIVRLIALVAVIDRARLGIWGLHLNGWLTIEQVGEHARAGANQSTTPTISGGKAIDTTNDGTSSSATTDAHAAASAATRESGNETEAGYNQGEARGRARFTEIESHERILVVGVL